MIVAFNKVDWNERPILLLKNMDGHVVCPLSYAHKISLELNYNETSVLSFELPRYVDGEEVEGYDKVVGMRIVDLLGIGQFILVNPTTIDKGGTFENKTCKAYSLEFELTYKTNSFLWGDGCQSMQLYNYEHPSNTILGKLIEDYPSWHIGHVDEDIIARRRYFDENDKRSFYDMMKNVLQKPYRCIFDFDTYTRTINAYSVDREPANKQVYLATENLAKEIKVEEDTENIFTALEVHGAEGVDLGDVNPTGDSLIYNFDYFMTTDYFSQEIIDKWYAWKTKYNAYRQPFYELVVAEVLQEARLEAAKADLQYYEATTKASKEEEQGIWARMSASDPNVPQYQQNLAEATATLSDISLEINKKKQKIDDIQRTIDVYKEDKRRITEDCKITNNFTEDEWNQIDRYLKIGVVEESTFVSEQYKSYVDADSSLNPYDASFRIYDAKVHYSEEQTRQGVVKTYYVENGRMRLTFDSGRTIDADVVMATVRVDWENQFVMSAYLNDGNYDEISFPGATVVLLGKAASIVSDARQGDDGVSVECTLVSGDGNDLFFTENATEYSARSTELRLFDYGMEQLEKLSWPSYKFSISAANFLAMSDFEKFRNQLELGEKIYVKVGDKVLEPILLGAKVEYDDPSKLTLEFGDKYYGKDAAFSLVDLLDLSVSMGKALAKNQLNYNSFIDSGASNSVRDFMNSSLDAAKNAVLCNSGRMDVTIDGNGIRLREWEDDEKTEYNEEQIWMINNMMVFTDDNWEHAKMAIGHFKSTREKDANGNYLDYFGICAPQIVGTLLAGNNLVIECDNPNGGTSLFRVDSDGAFLYNSQFDIVNELGGNQRGWIKMQTPLGIVCGPTSSAQPLFAFDHGNHAMGVYTKGGRLVNRITDTIRSVSDLKDESKRPRASFWTDMDGNGWFQGNIYAENGYFSGDIHATSGYFTGTIEASTLKGRLIGDNATMNGVAIVGGTLDIGDGHGGTPEVDHGMFSVKNNGDVTMLGNLTLANGVITFDNLNDETQGKIDDVYDLIEGQGGTGGGWAYEYQGNTYIDSTQLYTQTVTASKLQGGTLQIFSNQPLPGKDPYSNNPEDFKMSGHLITTAASSSDIALRMQSFGSLEISSGNINTQTHTVGSGDVYIKANNGHIVLDFDGIPQTGYSYPCISCHKRIIPSSTSDSSISLGDANYHWLVGYIDQLYSEDEPIISSDKNIKKDVSYGLGEYDKFFDGLQPCSYRFINGHERKHFGLISQDVEQLIEDCGLTSMDVAAFIKTEKEDEEGFSYALRYGEFISLLIYEVQELKRRVKELENT